MQRIFYMVYIYYKHVYKGKHMETNDNRNEQMGLTEEHVKEMLSRSYVQAIVSACGFNMSRYENDYGMDGTISIVKFRKDKHTKGVRKVESGYKLDFQLKASINVEIDEENIKYDLEVKNYNDLVDEDIGTPRVLIVYQLPRNKEEWIKVGTSGMELKGPAWWCTLSGEAESDNEQKKRIAIPRKQQFNMENLKELMGKVKRGEL